MTVNSGELTVGWEIKPIGEVCKTGAGGTPLKSNKEYYEGGQIPWLLSGEVAQGEIFKSENFITQTGLDNSSAKIFPVNTVLVAMYGATAGQVGILRFEAATNQAVCGILPNETFIPEFIYYALLSKKAELISKAAGNAQPNISQIKIRTTEIPVPPLDEQKRIVGILDEAFEGCDRVIRNTEKNLANSRELFESYLNAIFTQKVDRWKEHKLEDICSITSKLVDPRQSEFLDLPHVGAGNMISLTGELMEVKTAREEELISGKFLFDKTMVLYSKIRPYLMKACRPDFSGLCSADVYPLLPNKEQLNRDFLFHLLMSRNFTDYAISGSDRAGMPKVNRDHLFRYSISIPSFSEQIELAKKVDELSLETQRLESIYKQKITTLNELKQSILQKAFTGKLTTDSLRC